MGRDKEPEFEWRAFEVSNFCLVGDSFFALVYRIGEHTALNWTFHLFHKGVTYYGNAYNTSVAQWLRQKNTW